MTLSDFNLDIKVTRLPLTYIHAHVLCTQLTRDLFAIAKFLSILDCCLHINFYKALRGQE